MASTPPQPQSAPMFSEQLINKICCSIINRLLASLNCFSAPISDLHELDDGVVLVELIECFEDTMFVKLPQAINSAAVRVPVSRTQSRSNMEYVESWLKVEGIHLDPKRSIREIFAEIRRSSVELANFMGTFSHSDLNDGSSLASMLQKQRVAIYARSIAYISALCYAIFTIFLKHGEHFKRFIPGYDFQVQPDELLHILFYTKWKLTEEELLLKDLENMRLKDSLDLLEIENRKLKGICQMYGIKRDNAEQVVEKPVEGSVEESDVILPQPRKSLENRRVGTGTDVTGTASKHSHREMQTESEVNKDSLNNSVDFESVSSVTLSSIAEMKTVATLTDIFGLDNELLVRYGFNKKLMEMKDREIAEKIAQAQAQRTQQEQSSDYGRVQSISKMPTSPLNNRDQSSGSTVSTQQQHPIEPTQNHSTRVPQSQSANSSNHNANINVSPNYHHPNETPTTQGQAQPMAKSNHNQFQYNKLQVELALTGKRSPGAGALSTVHEEGEEWQRNDYEAESEQSRVGDGHSSGHQVSTTLPTNQEAINTEAPVSHSHPNGDLANSSSLHGKLDNVEDEQLRNRILIARLLAELSYEKNKNMKSLRQTNQDYI